MATNQIIIKNSLKIVLGIVVYFFAMRLFGLENVSELRFLNFIFVVWGINSSIKDSIYKNKNTSYLDNLSLGIFTSVLAVIVTIVGLIIYVSFVNPQFMEVLKDSFLWGKGNLELHHIVFALLIEGVASSVICSFILMQYWKNYKLEKGNK